MELLEEGEEGLFAGAGRAGEDEGCGAGGGQNVGVVGSEVGEVRDGEGVDVIGFLGRGKGVLVRCGWGGVEEV